MALATPTVQIHLVGPLAQAEALCEHSTALENYRQRGRLVLVDADPTVSPHDDPLASLVDQRGVAPWVAASLVKSGDADAAVFVGHTGAAVAASALVLGRIEGISRPVLTVRLPGTRGPVVLADTGAFLDATPEQLAETGVMAAAYARALGLGSPRVALLSIGAEAGKGDALRKVSAGTLEAACKRASVEWVGLVEGHDLASGEKADVIVTDGFTGNVALKAMEGAVAWIVDDPDLPALARQRIGHRMNAGASGGAVLLGVRGLSVVTHGASDEHGIASAIALARDTSFDHIEAQIRSVVK